MTEKSVKYFCKRLYICEVKVKNLMVNCIKIFGFLVIFEVFKKYIIVKVFYNFNKVFVYFNKVFVKHEFDLYKSKSLKNYKNKGKLSFITNPETFLAWNSQYWELLLDFSKIYICSFFCDWLWFFRKDRYAFNIGKVYY